MINREHLQLSEPKTGQGKSYFDMEIDYEQPRPDWWTEEMAAPIQRLTLITTTLIEGIKWGVYQCSCGKETTAKIKDVNAGNTRSCGCSRNKGIEYRRLKGRERQKRYYKKNKV